MNSTTGAAATPSERSRGAVRRPPPPGLLLAALASLAALVGSGWVAAHVEARAPRIATSVASPR